MSSAHIQTQREFGNKAEALAVEVLSILLKGNEANRLIATIIAHQAAEHALKATCMFQGKDIFEKGGNTTIGFASALDRLKSRTLKKEERTCLQILNGARNNFQHHALYDIKLGKGELICETLTVIRKLLGKLRFPCIDLDNVLTECRNQGLI